MEFFVNKSHIKMPRRPVSQINKQTSTEKPVAGGAFEGFQALDANFLYCPNQFFDVCLPNHSRGTVRLVAYMLRQTLGWLNEHGEPVHEQVSIPYRRLISRAGISRGAIRAAIDEAVEAGFISCIQSGTAKARGDAGQTAKYVLRWDESKRYIKSPKAFSGFYSGEGNRSPIPNAFFDQVVIKEPLSVVKVVGSVLRHTVGYQSRFGGRRKQAPLSYSYIQRYTNIADRTTLSQSLHRAIDVGYVHRIRKGRFDPSACDSDCAAIYAVRWRHEGVASNMPSGKADGDGVQDRFKNPTRNGSTTRPVNRSKNQTKEKTLVNNISKQQQYSSAHPAAANAVQESIRLLRGEGFDEQAASRLALHREPSSIRRQIEWLKHRHPSRNRLGLLRRAIEADWPAPVDVAGEVGAPSPAAEFTRHFYAALAGNTSRPMILPTRSDILAAEECAGRLQSSHADDLGPAGHGRVFGAYVRSHKPPWMSVVSFQQAVRYFGDEFVNKQAKALASQEVLEQKQRQEQYLAEHTPKWHEYLAAKEGEMRAERGDDYARFLAWRRGQRQDLKSARFLLRKQEVVARFDSEQGRLQQFQEFFSDHVLAFEAWDEKFNRHNTSCI